VENLLVALAEVDPGVQVLIHARVHLGVRHGYVLLVRAFDAHWRAGVDLDEVVHWPGRPLASLQLMCFHRLEVAGVAIVLGLVCIASRHIVSYAHVGGTHGIQLLLGLLVNRLRVAN